MKAIYISANRNTMKQAAEHFAYSYFTPVGSKGITHFTKTDSEGGFFYIENDLYEITHAFFSNEYRIEKIPDNSL